MERTSETSGTESKSGQGNTTPGGSCALFSISGLVLAGSGLVFAALASVLSRVGGSSLGLLTCLSSVLAAAGLIGVFVLLSVYVRAKSVLPRPRAALISTLRRDPDPLVRAKAAESLAKLDVEQASHHHEHTKLDTILISALQQDPDPLVRAKAAEGLAEVELGQEGYLASGTDPDL